MADSDLELLLGVTGSIACYKACEITSRLTRDGVGVNVVLTETAADMISPSIFETLAQREAYEDLFASTGERYPAHIELADRVDAALVAPATANVIGELASGIADDLLTSLLMAIGLRVPVYIAPAMNPNMFENPIVEANRSRLSDLGYRFIDPGEGHTACGDLGTGRLAEVDRICEIIQNER